MSDIRFDPVTHSYWIGDKQLQSVTTLIKSITPEFDKERISQHCAKKDGVSQEEILRQWEAKAEEGRTKGTEVHAYIDNVLSGNHDDVLSGLNVRVPEMDAFDSAWKAMVSKLGAKIAGREWIIGNESLGVAGRLDVILAVNSGVSPRKCVFDWKTGKFNAENRFAKLLPPFQDCDDCELVKYSLQCSMYRLILETNGEKCSDSYLVHLKSDGRYFSYRAIDYRERVEKWLKERKS